MWKILLATTLVMPMPAAAQPPLSLSDAIARASARNPDAGAAAAAAQEAAERVAQVRGGYLPKVDVAESWQRGNQPAFVFSSRLAQRQFTTADFALESLNHPAVADSFRTALSIEQTVFDRSLSAKVQAASIARDIAATGRQLVNDDLTSAVTDAFGRVLVAAATARSVAATVASARANRELASHRRDAGQVTDGDVLQMDVYLAHALERQVRAASDERIARARLNQLMGEPLGATFTLDLTPPAIVVDISRATDLEEEALNHRPEVALAKQHEQLAAAAVAGAHAAFLPQVVAQGEWELNGPTWISRSPGWVAGASLRLNLFHGFADNARLAEARQQAARRALEREKAETMVRLDVHTAIARLEAARESQVVGRAAADQARESHRIVRDRYEGGLVDASVVLRAVDDMQQAEAQQIAARVNVLTATANLQRAIGRP